MTCTLISRSEDGPVLLEHLTTITQARQAMNEAQKDPGPLPEAYRVGYHDMRDRLLAFAGKSLVPR